MCLKKIIFQKLDKYFLYDQYSYNNNLNAKYGGTNYVRIIINCISHYLSGL